MNYYIVPTKRMNLALHLKQTTYPYPHISSSFFNNIVFLKEQADNASDAQLASLNETDKWVIRKINNVYPFLMDIIPETILTNNTTRRMFFFTVIEIFSTFDFYNRNNIIRTFPHIVYIGNQNQCFSDALRFYMKTGEVQVTPKTLDALMEHISTTTKQPISNSDSILLFFDLTIPENDHFYNNRVIVDLLKVLYISMTYRHNCIIKIGNFIYKPLIDILYSLSSIYNFFYISKPSVVENINDRYIVCKDPFVKNISSDHFYAMSEKILSFVSFLESNPDAVIESILESKIAHHFMNKIEEATLIIGQKYIEYFENANMIVKLYGKEDKIESIRKSSLIKCIQWCDKHHIQHMMKFF